MNPITSILLWSAAIISVYYAIFWFLVYLEGGSAHHARKTLTELPSVTIVIPAWNECVREETGEVRGVVDQTIEHALSLDYPKDKIQLIVVNDASTDGTRDIILKTINRHKDRDITFIDKTQNGGKWRAMNDALAKAKGDYLVSLDGDSLLRKDMLKRMLPYFVDETVACVCPNMCVMEPTNFIERMQWYEYVVNMFYKKLMSSIDCVHVAPGPFSIYRIHILHQLGGFRHGYKTEDLEITYRMQKAGYKVRQVMDVKVETKAPPQWKAFYRQRNRWFKGATLTTLKDYKDLIFNKKYGDFGMVQVPLVIISGVLALILSSTFVYYNAKYVYHLFTNLWRIDFDIISLLQAASLNFNLLDVDYVNLFTVIFMITLSIFVLRLAHRASEESVVSKGVFPLLGYFFFYYLLLSLVWLGVLYDIMRNKELEW